MPADLPTREQVEREQVMDVLRLAVRSRSSFTLRASLRALCDLALRVLDSPERTLTPAERATWGTCKTCGAKHGEVCCSTSRLDNVGVLHPARLDAAPLRVQLVAVP